MFEELELILEEVMEGRTVELTAKLHRKILDALLAEGFTREEAIELMCHTNTTGLNGK